MLLGARLKMLRLESGFTLEQVEKATYIKKRTLIRYEKGEIFPGTHNLKQLVVFYNISADYLLGLSDIKTINFSKMVENCLLRYESSIKNPIIEKETYYSIHQEVNEEGDIKFECLSEWSGLINSETGQESRVIRAINPHSYIKWVQSRGERVGIINDIEDLYAFEVVGGEAIIAESVCREYAPYMLEPIIIGTDELYQKIFEKI